MTFESDLDGVAVNYLRSEVTWFKSYFSDTQEGNHSLDIMKFPVTFP